MLVEYLVRLGMERERCRIPDQLVDPNPRATQQVDQKHGVTIQCLRVDLAGERDRDSRLQAPAIERIDHRQIVAVRWASRAVGQRVIHPTPGILGQVLDREDVGRKWATFRTTEIERRIDAVRVDVLSRTTQTQCLHRTRHDKCRTG